MSPYMEYTTVFIYALDTFVDLTAQQCELLGVADFRYFAIAQQACHLAEYPRSSDTGTAYHHTVHPVAVERLYKSLGSCDVAIAYYRYL